MKVILLQDVQMVGRKNEVKEVRDGYARNFLLPRKLAEVASGYALKTVAARKEKEAREQSEDYQRYKALVEQLKTITLHFKMKVAEKGRAFGSVTAAKVRDALKMHTIEIEKEWIVLEESIKTTGAHQVKIKFPHGVKGEVNVVVEGE